MSKGRDFSHHPDVMVSSTYIDLTTHRAIVCEALLRVGFFPVGMEYDSAKAGKDIIASSMDMVKGAQAYICLIGHRYGGVPNDPQRNPNELSITELEYRASIARGIPVFVFLMSEDHPVRKQDVEPVESYQRKLEALKGEAQSRFICASFSSVEELKSQVLQSMFELRERLRRPPKTARESASKKRPVAAPVPPELLAIPNFVPSHNFVGRREEMAWLDEWETGRGTLLVMEAIGGTGKSTLAWEWLKERARIARPDLAGLFWYSFYEGGADMAAFAASAFAYVTEQDGSHFRRRKVSELGPLLVSVLGTRPFLLVLDGLERVLVAYHRFDASQARDDQVAFEKDDRACIKPADADLLRQLIAASPSKIMITSRLLPTALLNRSGQLLPGVDHLMLTGLQPDDALTLMRTVGIRGDGSTIKRYLTKNFDNHPQIVGIVAGLVNDYFKAPGDFDQWAEDPNAGAALHLSKLNLVQRQTHILATALSGLEQGVRQVLSRIAALGASVLFETIEALNPFLPRPPKEISDTPAVQLKYLMPHLESLQSQLENAPTNYRDTLLETIRSTQNDVEVNQVRQQANLKAIAEYRQTKQVALAQLISALQELDRRGLVQWDRQKNSYDIHPVVRGYAFDILEQPEREVICINIADHFRSKPADIYSETGTLADVQQSMDIFRALVQANQVRQALDFYRGDFANALAYSIEAYHEIVAMLKPMFPEGFEIAPEAFTTNPWDQSYLLNNAAVALISLGRLPEARGALVAKIPLNLRTKDWPNLCVALTNLGETLRDEHRFAQARRAFNLAVELATAFKLPQSAARSQWYLMTTYRLTGQFEKARWAYAAIKKLKTPVTRAIYRDGDIEEELCWLDFYQGLLAKTMIQKAYEKAQSGNNRTVMRGLARLRGELALKHGAPSEAIVAFENAIEMSQAVGLTVGDCECRLALAKIRNGEQGPARDICDRIHESDKPPHVELARAYLELGDRARAQQHALSGYPLAWADGPPYSLWWDLRECREILKALSQPEPQLRTFSPFGEAPLPSENEIRQVITGQIK